jgi:shikimate kinase
MGAGKSTIGRVLSQELNLEYKDSDREVEERAGADIPWIFDVEGEEGFRKRETAALIDLTQMDSIVLATGGGAVLREENQQLLQSRGTVIYLCTTIDYQLERTSKDRNRPLLQTEDPRQVLTELMAARDPIYRRCCDYVVQTDGRRPKAVAREIIALLEEKA